MTTLHPDFPAVLHCDVLIVGAGLIGLATALELHDRGASVVVLDRRRSLAGASVAAAGMLAAEDPCNPPALGPLSHLSIERYPAFLRHIEALSGLAVPFQTDRTLQQMPDGTTLHLAERSIDPRQLAQALRATVASAPIQVFEDARIASAAPGARETSLHLESGVAITARSVVIAAGAWTPDALHAFGSESIPIVPRKGQMLRVRVPSHLEFKEVRRNEGVYIVPRHFGKQAGTALIGATVEDAGFDTTVHARDLWTLREHASDLAPELASPADAPIVESWAGLRPATPDLLPVIGALAHPGHFLASGHYRNGILLAPATALVIADLIEGRTPPVDLAPLAPTRFLASVRA